MEALGRALPNDKGIEPSASGNHTEAPSASPGRYLCRGQTITAPCHVFRMIRDWRRSVVMAGAFDGEWLAVGL